MNENGVRLAIYEALIGGTQAHPSVAAYVVADSIDDALRGVNDFIDKYPWRDEKPNVYSVRLEHSADFVIFSSKYAPDRGEAV
jgi:hypothetical protein